MEENIQNINMNEIFAYICIYLVGYDIETDFWREWIDNNSHGVLNMPDHIY